MCAKLLEFSLIQFLFCKEAAMSIENKKKKCMLQFILFDYFACKEAAMSIENKKKPQRLKSERVNINQIYF